MTNSRGLAGVSLLGFVLLSVGCAGNPNAEPQASVFVFQPGDLTATIELCRKAPSVTCRNDMIYVTKAHIDAAHLAQPKDRNLLDKTFGLLVLGGSTATTRGSDQTTQNNVATGLLLVSGIRQIFDVGEERAGLHSSAVWEKIVARTNLPLATYPLEAALADLEQYRVVRQTD